jgi:GntR family transcriptional regulator
MLQRSSPLPLYHQLKQLLADRIQRGEWKPGDLVPGEHELQGTFHLSRTTVRQAMQELEREGFVTRHRGRGTFVARPRAVHNPAPTTSVRDYLLAQGIQPGWRVLTSGPEPAPPDIAGRLQLAPGALAFCSRRLRLADDAPLGHLEAWTRADLLPRIDPAKLAVGGSREYLRAPGLLKDSRAERTLAATAATNVEAELLAIPPGAPLLEIHRITFAADGRVLEDSRARYRGDRFRYPITPAHEQSPTCP